MVGRCVVHDRPSACVDPLVKRSRFGLRLDWWAGVDLHVSMTAHVSNYVSIELSWNWTRKFNFYRLFFFQEWWRCKCCLNRIIKNCRMIASSLMVVVKPRSACWKREWCLFCFWGISYCSYYKFDIVLLTEAAGKRQQVSCRWLFGIVSISKWCLLSSISTFRLHSSLLLLHLVKIRIIGFELSTGSAVSYCW